MKFFSSLDKNLSFVKKRLSSDDVVFLDLNICKTPAVLVFIDNVCDKKTIGELIVSPLNSFDLPLTEKDVFSFLPCAVKKIVDSPKTGIDEIINGNALLITEGFSSAISVDIKKFEKRAVTEPPTSAVIKGPREGFVESLPANMNMIRKRLKTPDLTFKTVLCGKYSNTSVAVCYIKSIADKITVDKITAKLKKLSVDAVLDSSYVSKFLGEHKTSLFKQLGNTEKPDILVAKILEGRIAVLVDGSPIALTLPYLLIEDFQSPSDYYSSPYFATFSRIIRLISVAVSVLLPAFFVSAELFHLQLIPLSFLLTIVNSIKGIPLSPSFEMLFTLLIFEILNEASVRMPKYVGMVVSIVGGLVLGETAVSAGIISAPTLMIVALSGICLFTVPELEQTFSLIRFIFLIVGGSLGGYGLILCIFTLIVYLVSFESFKTPVLAPFSPLIKNDLKDGIYKEFAVNKSYRPFSINNKNRIRRKYYGK